MRENKLERPKLLFVSRKFTVLDLIKYIISIFSFLKESSVKSIQLWVLDQHISFEQFEIFVNNSINNESRRRRVYVDFPGFLLNNFINYIIGDLEEIIQNKTIVIECLDLYNDIQFNNSVFMPTFNYNMYLICSNV
jgi:hypothetical protein